MSRYASAVLLAMAVLVLLVGPGYGQESPVELRLKLTRGEVLYYAASYSGEYGPPSRTDQSRYREAVRVLEVEADGTALVEVGREDFRNPDGSPAGWTGAYGPEAFRVRPDGTITERLSGRQVFELVLIRGLSFGFLAENDNPPTAQVAQLLADAHRTEAVWRYQTYDFPIPLPPRSVRPGESWNRSNTIMVHGVSVTAAVNGTLERIERTGDGTIARLRIRIEGRGSGRPFAGLPSGIGITRSVSFRRIFDVAWSVERGRLVQGTEEELRESQSTIVVQSQSALGGKITSKDAVRRETVSPEGVTVPAVATAMVVTPGKGIGSTTLELSVEELSNRLGVAELREQGLYRAPSWRWPNGLVGFVDSANQNQLLGFEISDGSYRTDKGIGFGVPEGAVLMAYGMSPLRLNMMIPNVGGVRVLIYDDQGIAFAITSDAQHAGARGRHAPIRTVDWMTVFPPGGAGKIYALP